MDYNAHLKPEEQITLGLRSMYEMYGYKKYSMGKFEEYSLYADNLDFLAGDRVITFTDLDGRLKALKPDVTLSIIKNSHIAEVLSKESVEKLYYIENVYRENNLGDGFREINQLGLECIGDVDSYGISEVVALAVRTLESVDSSYILEMSHMDYVLGLIESMGFSESVKNRIIRLISRKNTDGIRSLAEEENLSELQTEALCSIPSLYGDVRETVEKARKIAMNSKMNEALDNLLVVYEGLEAMGAADNVQADFSIMNHIEYYNGIIFNGYLEKLGSSILAGGQYDGVIRRIGKKGRGIGFALYLNEVGRLRKPSGDYDVDVALLYDEGESILAVSKAVKDFQEMSCSVFAAKEATAEVRAKKIYYIHDGRTDDITEDYRKKISMGVK